MCNKTRVSFPTLFPSYHHYLLCCSAHPPLVNTMPHVYDTIPPVRCPTCARETPFTRNASDSRPMAKCFHVNPATGVKCHFMVYPKGSSASNPTGMTYESLTPSSSSSDVASASHSAPAPPFSFLFSAYPPSSSSSGIAPSSSSSGVATGSHSMPAPLSTPTPLSFTLNPSQSSVKMTCSNPKCKKSGRQGCLTAQCAGCCRDYQIQHPDIFCNQPNHLVPRPTPSLPPVASTPPFPTTTSTASSSQASVAASAPISTPEIRPQHNPKSMPTIREPSANAVPPPKPQYLDPTPNPRYASQMRPIILESRTLHSKENTSRQEEDARQQQKLRAEHTVYIYAWNDGDDEPEVTPLQFGKSLYLTLTEDLLKRCGFVRDISASLMARLFDPQTHLFMRIDRDYTVTLPECRAIFLTSLSFRKPPPGFDKIFSRVSQKLPNIRTPSGLQAERAAVRLARDKELIQATKSDGKRKAGRRRSSSEPGTYSPPQSPPSPPSKPAVKKSRRRRSPSISIIPPPPPSRSDTVTTSESRSPSSKPAAKKSCRRRSPSVSIIPSPPRPRSATVTTSELPVSAPRSGTATTSQSRISTPDDFTPLEDRFTASPSPCIKQEITVDTALLLRDCNYPTVILADGTCAIDLDADDTDAAKENLVPEQPKENITSDRRSAATSKKASRKRAGLVYGTRWPSTFYTREVVDFFNDHCLETHEELTPAFITAFGCSPKRKTFDENFRRWRFAPQELREEHYHRGETVEGLWAYFAAAFPLPDSAGKVARRKAKAALQAGSSTRRGPSTRRRRARHPSPESEVDDEELSDGYFDDSD
ncbi:hypothetical protein BDZ89DRAFT_1051867 [Hymenopellis radicata]|nr:hypothetical protein BDZ89DRAFT_1051867 [Hymenopellis radicata]